MSTPAISVLFGARVRGLLCGAAVAVYCVFVVAPACRNPNTNGFAAYYTISRIFLETPRELRRAYDDPWFQERIDTFGFARVRDVYFQPPTMSLMLAPLAWMSAGRARIGWIICSVAFWWSGVALLVKALARNAGRSVAPWLRLVALTTLYIPLADNFRQGQGYALLFLLLCALLYFAQHPNPRRAWLAGVPLGFMLVLKMAGVWFWPFLLAARRWGILSAAAVTALAVTIFALPAVDGDAWRRYLHDLPRLSSDPVRYVTGYQTVSSLTGHLFVFDSRWNPAPVANHPRIAIGLALFVTAVALIVSAWLQRLASDDRDARALSWGLLTALCVSLAPVAESYHYLLVLPAVIVALWWATEKGVSRLSWAFLLFAILLLITPVRVYDSRHFQAGSRALLAYPRLYGAFALWGWLACALCQYKQHPQAASVDDVAGARVSGAIDAADNLERGRTYLHTELAQDANAAEVGARRHIVRNG